MRGTSTNLLLAVLSTLITLGAVEGYLRVKHALWKGDGASVPASRKSSNPVLLWEYRPGSTRKYHLKDEMYSGFPVARFNRFGFRDRDSITETAEEDEYRVAFVGDSVTEGLGIRQEDTFVKLFEAGFNIGSDTRVTALNFGIGGYNALQISELLRTKVIAFQPDVMVYVFHLNDFDFEDASGRLIDYYSAPPRFHLARLVARTLPRIASRHSEYHHRHFNRNRESVLASLRNTADFLAERGIPFVVAVLPVFRHHPESQAPPLLFGTDSAEVDGALQDIHDEVLEFLQTIGVPAVDLRRPFVELGPANVALDRWHPNVRGHRMIAQELLAASLDRIGAVHTE